MASQAPYSQSGAACPSGSDTKSDGRNPTNRKAFALARKAFLDVVKRHPDFAVAYEIAQGFNYDTFVSTGWLVSWLSLRTIGESLGISKNAVQRRIDRLEIDGLLAIDPGRGRGVSTRYYDLTCVPVSETCVPVSETCVPPSLGTPGQTHLDSLKDSGSRSIEGSASPNACEVGVEGKRYVSSTAALDRWSIFVMFWRLHPRPKHKEAAFAAFNRALDRGIPVETIMTGIRRFRDACEAGEYLERKRWPLPVSWLDSDGWEGYCGAVVALDAKSINIAPPTIGQPLAFDNAGNYTSPDGTVYFSANEIAQLEEDAYAVVTPECSIRQQIHDLVETPWISAVAKADRTKTIRDYIIECHNQTLAPVSLADEEAELRKSRALFDAFVEEGENAGETDT